ncbi:MAG TPA: hypothetical protein VGI39_15240 [Polyangiaceae bacterium]|jgi:hypothetical protein
MRNLILRVVPFAALAALATGCVAQAGDGELASSSSSDAPTAAPEGAHVAKPASELTITGPIEFPKVCAYNVKNQNGGITLSNPIIVNLFMGNYWETTQGQADMAAVNAAWKGMAGQAQLYQPITEYETPGVGSFWGSDWVGFGADQGTGSVVNQVQESLIQSFIDFELLEHRAPAPSYTQTIYFVYVGKGAYSQYDTTNGFNGHHKWYASKQAGQTVHYAVIDYESSLASFTQIAYHELMEAMTDPEGTAFYDPKTSEGEIGDMCEISASYDWGKYNIQQIWSQKACGCISAPNPPVIIRFPPLN